MIDKNGVIFLHHVTCVPTRIAKIQTFNILAFSNGIDLKLTPVVRLDKRWWFVMSSSPWQHDVEDVNDFSYSRSNHWCKFGAQTSCTTWDINRLWLQRIFVQQINFDQFLQLLIIITMLLYRSYQSSKTYARCLCLKSHVFENLDGSSAYWCDNT